MVKDARAALSANLNLFFEHDNFGFEYFIVFLGFGFALLRDQNLLIQPLFRLCVLRFSFCYRRTEGHPDSPTDECTKSPPELSSENITNRIARRHTKTSSLCLCLPAICGPRTSRGERAHNQ